MDCCFKKEGEEYAGKEYGGYRPKNGKTAGRKDWKENNGKESRKEHRDRLLLAGKTGESEKDGKQACWQEQYLRVLELCLTLNNMPYGKDKTKGPVAF